MKNIQELFKEKNIGFRNVVEEWKPIIGFKKVVDNIYEVSNYGDVRNIETKELRHKKVATKQYHTYYSVSLKHTNGQLGWVLVHQLVAWFFIPVPDELKGLVGSNNLVVDHQDNNGLNNLVTNLQWTTRGENRRLSYLRNDEIHSGDRTTDLNFEDLDNICKGLATGKSYKEILTECDMPYNKNNSIFLHNLAIKKHKLNIDDIIDKYNIDDTSWFNDEDISNINFSDLHNLMKDISKNKYYKRILSDCGYEYTLSDKRDKSLNCVYKKRSKEKINEIIDSYNINTENITSNSSRPTAQQCEIVLQLPAIRSMIALGKTNGEIVDELWPDLKKSTRKSRVRTVHRIREGRIYKNDKPE